MNGIIALLVGIVMALAQVSALIVLAWGFIRAIISYVNVNSRKRSRVVMAVAMIRSELGNSISLSLSFLIGSSILKSIIAPTWEDLTQLAAVIVLRTFLNYFLMKDMKTIECFDKNGDHLSSRK